MTTGQTAIAIEDLTFAYPRSAKPVLAIEQFSIARGERIFIHGPSGSGKSTLLGLLTGILSPQTGHIRLFGQDLTSLSSTKKDRLRGDLIGYIFQQFNLIPSLIVIDNIALACQLNPTRRQRLEHSLREEIDGLVDGLGIRSVINQKVTDLSVGQQQRVAVARALLGKPPLVVADEPTSALDYDNREAFCDVLFQQSKRHGATVVFVSHDHTLAHLFDRQISLKNMNTASL
jgi:putative ABC transport system ATP-binding protein